MASRDTIPTGSRLTLWAKLFHSLQLLWWVSVATESALVFALVRRNLHRIYTLFTIYLAADIVRSLTMMWLVPDTNSKAYARVWSVTEPALVLMQVAFAIELYGLISKHYRNFDRMRLRLFWTCLLSALVISLLVLAVDMPARWTSPLFQSILLGKRVVTFALAGFMLVLAIFLRIFSIPIRSNVTVHRRITTVYFLANASLYLAAIVLPSRTNAANLTLMCVVTGCFFAWIAWLRPVGEEVEVMPEPSAAEIEAHLQRGEALARRMESIEGSIRR